MFKLFFKYLKIYFKLFRFSIIKATAYPGSFLIGLAVEFGFQIAYVLFFAGILQNVKTIAGWQQEEIIFLAGLGMFTKEIIIGAATGSLFDLPRRIKDGEIDIALVKPINSMFYVSFGAPWFPSYFASITGLFIMFHALQKVNFVINFLNFVPFLIILLSGFVINFSLYILICSLSFKFINAKMLPDIAREAAEVFADRPHSIYEGFLNLIFFWIFPVVYLVSIPTYTLFHPLEIKYVFFSVGLAALFLFLTKKVWGKMIRLYSSASS